MISEIIQNSREIIIRAAVESESNEGMFYMVKNIDGDWSCTCPQNTQRHVKCKHIIEIEEQI